MEINTIIGNNGFTEVMTGGAVMAAIAALGFFAFVIFIGVYVYKSLAFMAIAKKQNHKYPWLAWIPFADAAMMLQLGGFHWAWIFLLLIPILGWIAFLVLFIIANWRIFEKEGWYPWFSLSLIIPQANGVLYLIAIGLVAWVDGPNKKQSVKKKPSKPKSKKK